MRIPKTAVAPGVVQTHGSSPTVPAQHEPPTNPSADPPLVSSGGAPAVAPAEGALAHLFRLAWAPDPVKAVAVGAALLFCGCSTVAPLPGGVAPNRAALTSWSQGRQGNCVTIATIKAVQTVFPTLQGERGVFRSVESKDGAYEVTMRDGFRLRITDEEVVQAKEASDFRIWSRSKAGDALFLYAVSAKRAQLEGNDGIRSRDMTFERALTSLNDGETVGNSEAFRRLGLKSFVRTVDPADTRTYSAVVVANENHAWFVTGGWGDNYGLPEKLGKEGWGAAEAVALVPPSSTGTSD